MVYRGKWMLNETIDLSNIDIHNLPTSVPRYFVSNGCFFGTFYVDDECILYETAIGANGITAYSVDRGWESGDEYRTIYVYTSNSTDSLEWLQSHAVQVEDQDLIVKESTLAKLISFYKEHKYYDDYLDRGIFYNLNTLADDIRSLPSSYYCDATAADIVKGKTAVVNNKEITGTLIKHLAYHEGDYSGCSVINGSISAVEVSDSFSELVNQLGSGALLLAAEVQIWDYTNDVDLGHGWLIEVSGTGRVVQYPVADSPILEKTYTGTDLITLMNDGSIELINAQDVSASDIQLDIYDLYVMRLW